MANNTLKTKITKKGFRGNKKANQYKSEDRYLSAVWKKNKDEIRQGILSEIGETVDDSEVYKKFKAQYKILKEQTGWSRQKTMDFFTNTHTFKTMREIRADNVISALKNLDLFNAFRKATGWNQKIDIYKFQYVGNNEYLYGNVLVSMKNSPQQIILKYVDPTAYYSTLHE